MIIVENGIGTVFMPKTVLFNSDTYQGSLTHNQTRKDYAFSVIDSSNNDNYYKFAIPFSGMPYGEYTYTITNGDNILFTGLMRYHRDSDYKPYSNPKTFEQHEQ